MQSNITYKVDLKSRKGLLDFLYFTRDLLIEEKDLNASIIKMINKPKVDNSLVSGIRVPEKPNEPIKPELHLLKVHIPMSAKIIYSIALLFFIFSILTEVRYVFPYFIFAIIKIFFSTFLNFSIIYLLILLFRPNIRYYFILSVKSFSSNISKKIQYKLKMKKYNESVEVYEQRLAVYYEFLDEYKSLVNEAEIEQNREYKKRYDKYLEERKSIEKKNSEIKEEIDLVNHFINKQILQFYPPNYLQLDTVYYLIYLVENHRADTMKEAINNYETDMHNAYLRLQANESIVNQNKILKQITSHQELIDQGLRKLDNQFNNIIANQKQQLKENIRLNGKLDVLNTISNANLVSSTVNATATAKIASTLSEAQRIYIKK